MQASETKFGQFVEGTKQYIVPLFQRPYSWSQKQWQVLWDDLVWLCENAEPKHHFMGAVVTMQAVSVPEGVAKYLVIDGQQRLTTLHLLLAAMRDVARKRNASVLAQEIEETMLVNRFKRGDEYFRLMPTQVDRAAYRSIINRQSPVELDSRIVEAYRFFASKLRNSDLEILKNVITSRLSLISILLASEDNAYLVFESLNWKGLSLTQADLIRNYYFMHIHVDEQETINNKYWQPMQDALGDSLPEFIRHFLMRDGIVVKKNDVYFTLKNTIERQDAKAHLIELTKFASYYERFLFPEREPNARIARMFDRLKRLDVTTVYPFLLRCYDEYQRHELSPDAFLEILRALESYIIRRYICGKPTADVNRLFPILYRQAARHENGFVDGVKAILTARGFPSDEEFYSRLISERLYGGAERNSKTKMLLQSLEEDFRHKEAVSLVDMSIEHIMPQRCNDWWQQHLGPDWQELHEKYVHTLGNLTLTGYNDELSNRSFPEKVAEFRKSHIELNREIATKTQWTPGEIEERAAALATRALAIWPELGVGRESIGSSDDVTGTRPVTLRVLKRTITVDTWVDVLEKTMRTLQEHDPDGFRQFATNTDSWFTTDPMQWQRSRPLPDGWHVYTYGRAQGIRGVCQWAVRALGLSEDDWQVEFVR